MIIMIMVFNFLMGVIVGMSLLACISAYKKYKFNRELAKWAKAQGMKVEEDKHCCGGCKDDCCYEEFDDKI